MKSNTGAIWVIALLLVSDCHGQEQLRKRQLLETTPLKSQQQRQTILLDYKNFTNVDSKIRQCFGDCDSSKDCQDGLICYHRDLDDDRVPGCSNKNNANLNTTNSVCIPHQQPQQQPPNNMDDNLLLKDHFTTTTRPVVPRRRNLQKLGKCQGDCEHDGDCTDDLVCLQRDIGDPIAGCPGMSLGTTRNYCVEPPEASNTRRLKRGECEGDCDSDDDVRKVEPVCSLILDVLFDTFFYCYSLCSAKET
jgi:hypothetical protein